MSAVPNVPEEQATPTVTAAPSAPVQTSEASLNALAAPGLSVLGTASLAAMVALVVVLCTLALYHAKFVKPPRTVATIDLDALVAAKEMAFIEQLSRPGIGDADRERAYEMVRSFGRDMDAAIAEAAASCQCDIFVRAAVVGRPEQDLTDAVGQRVGISMMAVADAKARVRNALTAASPTSGGTPSVVPGGALSVSSPTQLGGPRP